MKFTAKRYRPANSKHDRVQVITTEKFRKWDAATKVFRAFALITDDEMAHELSNSGPSSPNEDDWKYEFEIKTVERDY